MRGVLARIRQRSDTEDLNALINEILENHPEITTQSTEVLRTSVNNFINAELGGTAFNASRTHVNQRHSRQYQRATLLKATLTDSLKMIQDNINLSFIVPLK